jgi:bile acid:Na+ symporter, BASS family
MEPSAMSTLGMVQVLFVALALVMVGLGLSLELADFRRLLREKRAVVVALVLQMLILPLAALALATAMQLSTPYAVGLMLLAAAPGSISSNLYSHVFGGNVALNVSLTGVNTVLSMVTLPLICSWSLVHFAAGPKTMPAVGGKLLETMATLIVPVVVGMVVRAHAPRFAQRVNKPMRLVSVFVLVAFSAAAIAKEWEALIQGFAQVGVSVFVFNLLSLVVGYRASLAMDLDQPSAVAITFQLGVRSAVLSIYVAMTALNDAQMALPAAVYSITMVFLGLSFGVWAKRRASMGREASGALSEA